MANKKINQLVLKTTIQSTDLFPLGDATTGQLFKKTIAELQAAIGGAVISVNGLVGTVVLDTDDIQELGGATNRYFTDARARGAISLTVAGNSGASTYNSSTGVLNVPTYTLAGLGGITASFLSGASGIAYNSSTGVITYTGTVFTDASIRALVSAGAGLSYNSSTGVFSYSGTVYTDASIRALISLTTSGTSGASTYNNTTGVLNVPTYTLAGLGGIGAGFLSAGAGITYNSTTGVIASTITQYTDALARASISAGTGISYNNTSGVITNTITQYTDALARASISGGTGISYNSTTGVITNTITQYTDALARASLSAGTGITYNSSTGAISYSGTVFTDASVRALISGTAPITYNSSTGAIGITQASTSVNGFLSSTDWNTFNGKQSALTLGNVSEVVSNILMFPDGQNGKTIGNLSIQVVQAGSTTNGFLSSTNWNTFNNKQNAITLTTTGTSGASTFSGGTLNIPQYTTDVSGFVTLTTAQTISGEKTFSSTLMGTSAIFSKSSNSGSGNVFPRLTVSNTLATQGDGSSTFNFADINLSAGNGAVNMFISTTFAAGIWAPAAIINVASNHDLQIKTNNTTRLTIANTGAATFSSSVNLGTESKIEGNNWSLLSTAVNNELAINFAGKTGTSLKFYSAQSPIFSVTSAGAGVFNGSVTASSIISNGQVSLFDFINVQNNFPNFSQISGIRGRAYYQTNYPCSILMGDPTASNTNIIVFNVSNGDATGTEKARLLGNGNFLLGTSSDNGERLYVSGSIRATGSITANSDARLKKNIERIENALEKVGQISGYTYNTIYDEERHAGVIAQEIDKVLPEIVNKGNDGLMGVEYGNISALLIEAIKDLKKDNESLRAIVEGLSK